MKRIITFFTCLMAFSMANGQPCQPFTGQITSPPSVVDSAGVVQMCLQSNVLLRVSGNYPQSGTNYRQSDASSQFTWYVDNCFFAAGTSVQLNQLSSGVHLVRVEIRDTFGCRQTNVVSRQVNVEPSPIVTIAPLPLLCVGDSLRLRAKLELGQPANCQNMQICIQPQPYNPPPRIFASDSLCIPDGSGRPTSLIFRVSGLSNPNAPQTVITRPSDIRYISLKIEHSYLFDNDIRLTCPNGQTIGLHKFIAQRGPQIYLGNPNLGVAPIIACTNSRGYSWDYHWTPTATMTWTQAVDGVQTELVPMGVPSTNKRVLRPSVRPQNPMDIAPNRTAPWVDYTGQLMNYKPDDEWSNLIGCPVNGEWQLQISDRYGGDDGFISHVKIAFDSIFTYNYQLPPAAQITERGWNSHPLTTARSQDTMTIAASRVDNTSLIYKIRTATGCNFDRILSLSTREKVNLSNARLTHTPDSIYAGQRVTFSASVQGNNGTALTYQWYKNDTLLAGVSQNTYQTNTVRAQDRFKVVVRSTDANCVVNAVATSNLDSVKLLPPNATLDFSTANFIQIYPNPLYKNSDLTLNIENLPTLNNPQIETQWWTMDGKQLDAQQHRVGTSQVFIKTTSILGGGVFLLKIRIDNQWLIKKVVFFE